MPGPGESLGPEGNGGSSSGGGGSGTVTSFSFTNGGGFTGTVTNPTTTPALSLVASPSGIGAMNQLVRTAVKTTTYAAAASDLVPCDSTAGGFTVTLPTTPADKTLIEVKHIIQGITAGSGNIITIATGGADVINRAGGPTSVTLPISGQSRAFLYQSSTAIWTIVWAELPQTAIAVQTVTADPNPGVIGTFYRINYAGNGNFTLPSSPAIGSWITVKQISNHTTTFVGTIDGNAGFTITQFVSVQLIYNGTSWDAS